MLPVERREVRFIEAKAGEVNDVTEAVEIIAKGTIFAVITTGEIKLRAKLLFRAAGVIYLDNVPESEINSWKKIKSLTHWN